MRRDLIRFTAGLAVVAAAISAVPARAVTERQPLAVIAELSGRVDIARPAARSPQRGTLGLALQRGDKVQVAPGGSATLLFSDGNLVELAEKSSLTIGAQSSAAANAPASATMAGVFKSVSESVVGGSRETGLVALAPVRSGAERVGILLAPRQTELLDGPPVFRWRGVAGATRYRVEVSGDEGEIWRHETGETTLTYPADGPALPRDTDLLWKVTAADDGGPLQDEENGFRIKSAAASRSIRNRIEEIEKNAGSAASFLAGAYLGNEGLLCDAIARFEELCRRDPDQPGPHEALGQLYRAVGLTDLAAAELQAALTLSRQP